LGVAYFWVRPGEDFGTTLASYGNEIYTHILRFTAIESLWQWSEVVQTEANS
jgi:hypothetical protein